MENFGIILVFGVVLCLGILGAIFFLGLIVLLVLPQKKQKAPRRIVSQSVLPNTQEIRIPNPQTGVSKSVSTVPSIGPTPAEIEALNDQLINQLEKIYDGWQQKIDVGDIQGAINSLFLAKETTDKVKAVGETSVKGFFATMCHDTCAAINKSGDQRWKRNLEQCYKWTIEYANWALKEQPLDFTAQFIKTIIAANILLQRNIGFGEISNKASQQQGDLMTNLVFWGGIYQATTAKQNFIDELNKLAEIYIKGFQQYRKTLEDYIDNSQSMMTIADISYQQKVGTPHILLNAILMVNINNLVKSEGVSEAELTDIMNMVQEVRRLASAKKSIL